MNLGLLFPAALAALATLLVPLLIHLARREQQRPVVFAALRWLVAQPRARRRVRFDEWLLLLLRLLLLALLALWLAQPVRWGPFGAQRWHVLMPGVDEQALPSSVDATESWHWLVEGFPLRQPGTAPPVTAASAPVSLSSLLRQLDAELPAHVALTVHVPAILDGVDAQRPRLSRDVDWQVQPPRAELAQGEVVHATMPTLWLHQAGEADGLRFLRAAAEAWHAAAAEAESDGDRAGGTQAQAPAWAELAASTRPPDDARWLAWIGDQPLNDAVLAWVREGGTLLLSVESPFAMSDAASVLWRDADGAPVLRQQRDGAGTVLQWQRPLRPAAMPQLLEATFPLQLRHALQPVPAPRRVMAHDHAPLAGLPAWPLRGQDLRPWLLGALWVLLLLERWLATSRRRSVAP